MGGGFFGRLGPNHAAGQRFHVSLFRFKVTWRDLIYQIYFIGVKSQSVVLITGAFTGMVLGAQTYFQFHKVKMDTATLAVVSVSMCSELGPGADRPDGRRPGRRGHRGGAGHDARHRADRRAAHAGDASGGLPGRAAAAGAHIALPLLTVGGHRLGIGAGYLVGGLSAGH